MQLFKSKNQVVYIAMWIHFVLPRVHFLQMSIWELSALLCKDITWPQGVCNWGLCMSSAPQGNHWAECRQELHPLREKKHPELPAEFSLGLCSRSFPMKKNTQHLQCTKETSSNGQRVPMQPASEDNGWWFLQFLKLKVNVALKIPYF